MRKVSDVLSRGKLYVKMGKWEFDKTYLVYLGRIIGGVHLKVDPSKVEVIVNWLRPTIVIEVSIFLGVVQ